MSPVRRVADRNPILSTHGRRFIAVALGAIALVTTMPAYAFLTRPIVFAAVGRTTKAPGGWLQFCADNPGDCRPSEDAPRDVVLTPELLQQLYAINGYVNSRVTWTSDVDLYGKAEYWTYPLDRGDCEDIVLLKRRVLAEVGWPKSALLITVVEDPSAHNARHAVLTVHTDRGEFILDNQTPEVLFWYETEYHYVMRQSTTDPNVWVSFLAEQPRPEPASAIH